MRRFLYILRQFGIDPIVLIKALRGLYRYTLDYINFKVKFKGRVSFLPALGDFSDSAGSADGHYFWQDLICAKWVNELNPDVHFDVGSRVDGFVAHLLASRKVTLLDIRPLKYEIPKLTVIQGNIQQINSLDIETFQSVSSLHSIEHFGLGRYNDPIDVSGHEKGLLALASRVNLRGILYVSFPIGRASVQFNSQRIIDPTWPTRILTNFELINFVLIPWKGEPIYGTTPEQVVLDTFGQAGLYKFQRIS